MAYKIRDFTKTSMRIGDHVDMVYTDPLGVERTERGVIENISPRVIILRPYYMNRRRLIGRDTYRMALPVQTEVGRELGLL